MRNKFFVVVLKHVGLRTPFLSFEPGAYGVAGKSLLRPGFLAPKIIFLKASKHGLIYSSILRAGPQKAICINNSQCKKGFLKSTMKKC